ncbi:MAG: DUF4337 domain-containing protein [Ignavibacteriales bacterium]
MSEAELPNPEELEEIKGKSFTKRVALTTAIFAVILAIASLGGKNSMKEMLLAQQQASDQWAFYQAKVIRENLYGAQKLQLEADLAERSSTMKPEVRQKFEALMTKYADEEKHYDTEKKDIEKEARKLEHERDLNRSKDPYFDYAEVFLQIAIVMSSISILSGSRPLFFFSLVLAIIGMLLTLNGYTLLVNVPFLHIK